MNYMKSIGIYYHPSFSRKSYMTVGNRLRDFPEALEPLLARPNVRLIESPPGLRGARPQGPRPGDAGPGGPGRLLLHGV